MICTFFGFSQFRRILCLCAIPCSAIFSGCGDSGEKPLPLGVIGATEPVYIEPFTTPFPAKIDTGADIASIDAEKIREVIKNGKTYIAFTIRQRKTDAEQQYELPLIRIIPITSHGGKPQKRYVVHIKLRLGNRSMLREFSLANRTNFTYQVLLGKNVIAGNALIDVTKENQLTQEK